jgi:hypothetical protein
MFLSDTDEDVEVEEEEVFGAAFPEFAVDAATRLSLLLKFNAVVFIFLLLFR